MDAKGAPFHKVQQVPAMIPQKKLNSNSNAKVFITGYDFGTTEEQIWDHCASIGSVLAINMLGKGECAVEFESPDSVQAALSSLNGTTIAGNQRYIEVRLDAPQIPSSKRPALSVGSW